VPTPSRYDSSGAAQRARTPTRSWTEPLTPTEPAPDAPGFLELLRQTRPWWVLPFLVLLVLALVLVATDVVPLRDLAYAVM